MPLPTTKAELRSNLQSAYAKLDAEFDDVGVDLERDAGIEGSVSCCDVVAYQIGWAHLLMGWERQEKDGLQPVMPAPGYKWNQLGELAKAFYGDNAGKSLSELREELREVQHELLEWIDSLSAEELFEPHHRAWTGEKWAMIKWIQINTIAPYTSARAKVRKWRKSIGL